MLELDYDLTDEPIYNSFDEEGDCEHCSCYDEGLACCDCDYCGSEHW